jgi:hypothetical protein
MVKGSKWALVSAIFLMPFAYPHSSAFSRNWSLSYEEAVWMCSTGDHQACDVMYRFELARSAVSHGSPADQDPAASESLLVGGASAPLQPCKSLMNDALMTAHRLAACLHAQGCCGIGDEAESGCSNQRRCE